MMNFRILQFALANGIGDMTLKRIIDYITMHEYSWEDPFQSSDTLLSEMGLKNDVIQSIHSKAKQAQMLFEELGEYGVQIFIESETNYPQYLKRTLGSKCPPILFLKGNSSLLNTSAVGFCGSRKTSEKGVNIASNCAVQFAKQNITVVSGYAGGADLAVHRASLASGGNTIFVLAEGILKSKVKSEVKELLNSENHVFISQFMPKLTWNAGNAMKRNSVIIGLSRAMVLIEARKSGGTFSAGKEALQMGCPLYVIDFENPEVSAEANPYFISSGGTPIRGKNGVPNLSEVIKQVKCEVERECIEQVYNNNDAQIKFWN